MDAKTCTELCHIKYKFEINLQNHVIYKALYLDRIFQFSCTIKELRCAKDNNFTQNKRGQQYIYIYACYFKYKFLLFYNRSNIYHIIFNINHGEHLQTICISSAKLGMCFFSIFLLFFFQYFDLVFFLFVQKRGGAVRIKIFSTNAIYYFRKLFRS